METQLKACRICGSSKSLDSFHRDKSRKDGRRGECKPCKKKVDAIHWNKYAPHKIALNRKYKEANKKTVYAKAAQYKENNRELCIWLGARKRAYERSLEFSIEVEDIIIPEYCPLLGIELKFRGGMNNRDTSPSIDRLDSAKGYIKGNIKIISFRANRIKNDATVEEFKLMASRLDKYITEGD